MRCGSGREEGTRKRSAQRLFRALRSAWGVAIALAGVCIALLSLLLSLHAENFQLKEQLSARLAQPAGFENPQPWVGVQETADQETVAITDVPVLVVVQNIGKSNVSIRGLTLFPGEDRSSWRAEVVHQFACYRDWMFPIAVSKGGQRTRLPVMLMPGEEAGFEVSGAFRLGGEYATRFMAEWRSDPSGLRNPTTIASIHHVLVEAQLSAGPSLDLPILVTTSRGTRFTFDLTWSPLEGY